MLADRSIQLDVSERAFEALAREGYDPAYGARPLKRTIQRELANPLALKLLEGAFPAGSVIKVDYADGGFTFAGGAKPAPARKPRGVRPGRTP